MKEEMKDPTLCTCICHTQEGVRHCMPCCHVCPKCGKNITGFVSGRHKEFCEGQKEEKE